MNFKLEVIAFNIESCSIIEQSCAHRIELCDNPGEGGTTPSYGFIKAARKKISIELYPIIRPRGGDFLYSKDEFEIMKDDIIVCKNLGCDGVVTGLLQKDGRVDKERCSQLRELAYPMGVTFHRAFDRTMDPFNALEDIIEIGCERILTSGQKPHAPEGSDLISRLIQQADERIIIMPGSGVRAENIARLEEQTGAVEFHTSARTMIESKMNYLNKNPEDNLKTISVNKNEIEEMIKALKKKGKKNG